MKRQNRPSHKYPPLHEAAQRDDKATVLRLLNDAKADINLQERKYGRTALWVAAHGGHVEMVKLLLREGADRNIADDTGTTPEDIASTLALRGVRDLNGENPYPKIVRLLKAKQLDSEVDSLTEQFSGLGFFSTNETQKQPKPVVGSSTDNSIKSQATPNEDKAQAGWCVIS